MSGFEDFSSPTRRRRNIPMPTDFDRELDQLNLTYAQKELIKQACDRHVIGEDRDYSKLELCPVCGQHQYSCSCYDAEERLRNKQRQSLWGDKE